MFNIFDGLYTLIEIAIHHGYKDKDITRLKTLISLNNIEKIKEVFPDLEVFLPYCKYYKKRKGKKVENYLAMSAELYDNYILTGLLPDLNVYDYESNIEKLEHWEYNPPLKVEFDPITNWDFAINILNEKGQNADGVNIWQMLLSGNARMNYYTGEEITLEQRIKLAIFEYMIRRPQFFNLEDFYENPILYKKYNKKEVKGNGKEEV